MKAFGSVIDRRMKAVSAIFAFFASTVGLVSRSGPTVPVDPAGLNVWQLAQPFAAKTALPRAALAPGAAAVVVAVAVVVAAVAVVVVVEAAIVDGDVVGWAAVVVLPAATVTVRVIVLGPLV